MTNKITQLVKKEFKEYARERILFLSYILPLSIMLIIGYGLNMDTEHIRTIIIDNDKTPVSMKFSQKFYNTKYFDSQTVDISTKKALNKIKTNQAELLIIIPSNFEKNLLKGTTVQIGVYIDGVYPMLSKTMSGYVKAALYSFVANETSMKPKIVYEPRNLFNQSMKTRWAIIPGSIALIMILVPAMFSALMVVKEKERGTIFNFYASNMSKVEFLLGKVIPSFIIHYVTVMVLLIIAIFLFELPFRGSFILYAFSSALFLLISIGIGLLVSIVTKSQIAAIMLTAMVTIIPGVLYSGIMTPIDTMEGVASFTAHIYPMMYYVSIMYDTFLIGDGFSSLVIREYLYILVIFVLAIYLLNYLLLRKKL